ncbi:MAG: DUF58 domain-containing protein [Spirochaetes bacterium]|nr:DUF58 domain-containing protein [Spirochaetota bacterium]MBU1079031.1 DUF58 domain-containing protein [Spirochaetota bacterium]
MKYVDPECAAIASAFARRDLKARLPDSIAARDPMYRRSGSSYDLKSIREYQPFDDPRAIDWKLYGRSDRAFVKEFYEEADDEVAFLVDSSASMACAPQEDYRSFIGSLSFILLSLGMGVRLWTYSSGLSELRLAARSKGGHAAVRAALSSLEFEGDTDTARSFGQWRARGRQRRVFVFSDFHERTPSLRSPGGLFLLRFRTPFSSVAERGAETEVVDPETGRLIVVPWSRADEAAWDAAEASRDAAMASTPRSFYRRLDSGDRRAPVYWDVLSRLYA